MPLTVITLKRVPASLRGDLTRWMQEISTGVYVGNFNSRVRDKLWKRISECLDDGEATMTYACRNEIGYMFDTLNSEREVVMLDELPLVCLPVHESREYNETLGFSNAFKYRSANKYARKVSFARNDDNHVKSSSEQDDPVVDRPPYISIDVETDGLDVHKNHIIEVGAYWSFKGREFRYHSLVEHEGSLSKEITHITGITSEMLTKYGKNRKVVFKEFLSLIQSSDLLGYAVDFDYRFINAELARLGLPELKSKTYDLLKYVKRDKPFLNNYKLETVLKAYGIDDIVQHRALSDAELTFRLAMKVNRFQRKFV